MLCGRPTGAATPDYDWHTASIPFDTQVSFENRRGQAVTLAAFRGRPVLLNIWATWCAPCILELPALDRLQRSLKDRLSIVALSVDRSGMSAVLPALRRLSVRRLDAYVDSSGNAVSQLKIAALPATIAISATGAFLYVRRGRVNWDDPNERDRMRALLTI